MYSGSVRGGEVRRLPPAPKCPATPIAPPQFFGNHNKQIV